MQVIEHTVTANIKQSSQQSPGRMKRKNAKPLTLARGIEMDEEKEIIVKMPQHGA